MLLLLVQCCSCWFSVALALDQSGASVAPPPAVASPECTPPLLEDLFGFRVSRLVLLLPLEAIVLALGPLALKIVAAVVILL